MISTNYWLAGSFNCCGNIPELLSKYAFFTTESVQTQFRFSSLINTLRPLLVSPTYNQREYRKEERKHGSNLIDLQTRLFVVTPSGFCKKYTFRPLRESVNTGPTFHAFFSVPV
jgi:hypothetical protein